jgi:hypothetical protein
MTSRQVVLSEEVLTVMRTAVSHAIRSGLSYVAPAHVLLALLEDPVVGPTMQAYVNRDLVDALGQIPRAPGITRIGEGPIPPQAVPPFPRYDSLVFSALDGRARRWLDSDVNRMLAEGAARVETGRYLVRHLAYGFASVVGSDPELTRLIGPEPAAFCEAVYGL